MVLVAGVGLGDLSGRLAVMVGAGGVRIGDVVACIPKTRIS